MRKSKVRLLDEFFGTQVVNQTSFGSLSKRMMDPIPRRLVGKLRLLIDLPWVPGEKGRRVL